MNLSLTHTLRASDVSSVARFADATVGAQTVDTLTIPAQVPHHTALIDIWTEMRNASLLQVSSRFVFFQILTIITYQKTE